VVGAPSAGYKVVKGVDSHKDVFGRLKESAKQLAAGYEIPTIVGLDHQTFLTKKEAEAYKNTINAAPPHRVPYRVAFHPLDSRKVLTFITNNPHKAAELRDKASSNPFDNVSISSGSSRSSIEEPRPSTSHVEEEQDDPFASPEDATKEIRSGSLVHNPFAHEDDEENPFKG